MDADMLDMLDQAARGTGKVVVLTGAGISAESGIPTFRGKEGYWTVGAREYHPQEMATQSAFGKMPREVWRWYLYRRSVCRAAEPNAAHTAVARLEDALTDRFRLVTQNVDGLHIRAGNTLDRTYQIHGNIDFMRCSRGCSDELTPVPGEIPPKARDGEITDDEWALLECRRCGAGTRPHVLWFDECYDEPLFRMHSTIDAAREADLLIVIGTAGATNLPMQVADTVARTGGTFIDVNPEDNVFSQIAEAVPRGRGLRGPAAEIVPDLVEHLIRQ